MIDLNMATPAPIVQLLLTLQFQPPLTMMSILDWAKLRAQFEVELPIFTQVNRAGPMPARLGDVAIETPFGMPRLGMTSTDLSQVVLLQDDRISVGWNRTAPLTEHPEYPGFDNILVYAMGVMARVFEFIKANNLENIVPVVGEVSYTDAFLAFLNGKNIRKIEDIFLCVRSLESFHFSNMNLTYQRPLAPGFGDELDGMVETVISGLRPVADGQTAAQLQTTVRFHMENGTLTSLESGYRAAHRVAQSVFKTLVKPEASAILEQ